MKTLWKLVLATILISCSHSQYYSRLLKRDGVLLIEEDTTLFKSIVWYKGIDLRNSDTIIVLREANFSKCKMPSLSLINQSQRDSIVGIRGINGDYYIDGKSVFRSSFRFYMMVCDSN